MGLGNEWRGVFLGGGRPKGGFELRKMLVWGGRRIGDDHTFFFFSTQSMFKLGAYKIVISSTYIPAFFFKKKGKDQKGRRRNKKKKNTPPNPALYSPRSGPRLTIKSLAVNLKSAKERKEKKGRVRGQKTLFRPTKHKPQLDQFDNFIKITTLSGGQGEGGLCQDIKQRMSLPSFESSTSQPPQTLQWRRCSSQHSRGSLHN